MTLLADDLLATAALAINIQAMRHRGDVTQDKRLVRDTEQRAWVLNELKHTTVLNKPALLQLGCLRVPVFACPLCHEMEGVGDCEGANANTLLFKVMLVTLW